MPRPSSATTVSVALFVALFALARSASAAELARADAPAPAETPTAGEATVLAPQLPRERMTPMMAELHDALAAERTRLAALRAELARARGTTREAAAQRALAAAKRETEARLLRIQADHARREGRLEVAARLDAALAALHTPPAAREAAQRPAPVRDGGR